MIHALQARAERYGGKQFGTGKGSAIVPSVLFMVIEDFKDGDPRPIRERFVRDGRMLPDGVLYHASWVDPANSRCFQVMEAKDRDALQVWANCWADLVDFKIVPVLSSQEYWKKMSQDTGQPAI
jgi:Protein of unknown function (DUF3303)